MNQTQNLDFPSFERIETLILASERGDLNPAELEEFDHLIQDDPQARRFYARYIVETVDLISWAACPDVDGDLNSMMVEMEHLGMDGRRDSEMPTPNPNPSYFANACHGMFGFFSQEIPFAMLVATFITGLGLLVGSLVYVTHHQPVAADRTPPPSVVNSSDVIQELQFVGRVTGLDNVQWANIDTSTERGNGIPLGRKYALASGLMELTYDTGAKVILQGPCTYEVDSSDGGYLSVGKLTAKLEKGGEKVAGGQWSVASETHLPSPASGRGAGGEGGRHSEKVASGQKLVASGQWLVASETNPKSQISNPQSPAPMFAVRTPTALVTDLGTEFGVEVDKAGTTTSHVFRGTVQVQAVSNDGNAEGKSLVVHENQSARVENRNNSQVADNRVMMIASPSQSVDFVREIPKPTYKTLDLVDVVAGGDGFSGKRNAGIDPSNGETVNILPSAKKVHMQGDYRYHRVKAILFIDGVFIPDGRDGPVQVDSAGHAYSDFPATDNWTGSYIWTGASFILTDLGGIEYSSPGHGALVMHANKGITFDLAAIRKANPGWKPTRFRSIVGNSEKGNQVGFPAYADFWILVDGKAAFRRRAITRSHGTYTIDVPLNEKDSYLTLVATDGGNGFDWDWIIFGDPRLELVQIKTDSPQTTLEK